MLEILLKVRDEVEKGWCKGWGDTPGHVCILGAIKLVAGDYISEAMLAMFNVVGRGRSISYHSDQGREHALELIDRVIAHQVEQAHVYSLRSGTERTGTEP